MLSKWEGERTKQARFPVTNFPLFWLAVTAVARCCLVSDRASDLLASDPDRVTSLSPPPTSNGSRDSWL